MFCHFRVLEVAGDAMLDTVAAPGMNLIALWVEEDVKSAMGPLSPLDVAVVADAKLMFDVMKIYKKSHIDFLYEI